MQSESWATPTHWRRSSTSDRWPPSVGPSTTRVPHLDELPRRTVAEVEDALRTIVRWAGEKVLPPTLVLQHLAPRDERGGQPAPAGSGRRPGRRAGRMPISASSRTTRAPQEPPDSRGPLRGTSACLNVRSNQIGGIVRMMWTSSTGTHARAAPAYSPHAGTRRFEGHADDPARCREVLLTSHMSARPRM